MLQGFKLEVKHLLSYCMWVSLHAYVGKPVDVYVGKAWFTLVI